MPQGILTMFRDDREIAIRIDRQAFLVGRALEADVRLADDEQVSRKHCRIVREGGAFILEDLDSRNGTWLNGERIAGRRALTNHDVLKIGKRKMLFTVRGTPGSACPVKGTNCMACGGAIAPREMIEGLAELKAAGHVCSECAESSKRIKTVFHNYELVEKIAQGGMGVVYKARHQVLDTVVALKLMRETGQGSRDAVKRFMREVRLGARVQHPGIVRFLDAGEDEGTYYLIMEYCEGLSLADHLQATGRLAGLVRHVADQLFDAVGAIHAADMIHRDIKPANILLLDKDRIKLIDFGLAKSTGTEPWSVITATGVGLGTMQYVAPEQYSHGREVDRRADIYGLGATFYHMLCGRPPIIAETEIDFYHAMKEFSIPPADTVAPSVTPAISTWVMRALARDPEDRYSDVEEFRQAFREAYGEGE